jgi:hypothetical protein
LIARQHGVLAGAQVGVAMVDRDLFAEQRITREDPQQSPVRDHAVGALVRSAGGDHDHLFLGLAQSAFPGNQRVVIGKERAKFIRSSSKHQEYIGNTAGFSCTSLIRARTSSGRSLSRRTVKLLIGGFAIAQQGVDAP